MVGHESPYWKLNVPPRDGLEVCVHVPRSSVVTKVQDLVAFWDWPTATQASGLGQLTPQRWLSVPARLGLGSMVQAPAANRSIRVTSGLFGFADVAVSVAPTATHSVGLGHDTSRRRLLRPSTLRLERTLHTSSTRSRTSVWKAPVEVSEYPTAMQWVASPHETSARKLFCVAVERLGLGTICQVVPVRVSTRVR